LKPQKKTTEVPLSPRVVAEALRDSLADLPELQEGDLLRWGRSWGLEVELRKILDPEWSAKRYSVTGDILSEAPLSGRDARAALRMLISQHPERFQEVEQAIAQLQSRWLKGQAAKLDACGTTWRGHVIRVFWRDRKGQERLRRQIGIHRCKGAWCPSCGRTRQARIAGEVEKLLILTEDWGFHSGHARLVTLTTPNGAHLPTLREEAHHAFAKLQRTRWWNRQVFGFVRGSEVKTGEDGNWNFHIHFLLIFWNPRMDYGDLSDHWTAALGGKRKGDRNYTVDVESLEAKAWERKDGQEGTSSRRNLVRAARYISKYLCKGEELANLKAGPGGLGHLVASTKGLRRASFGGGCAVLRRAAHVLMPKQLYAAEEVLAGTPLHEGKSPLRVEVMDPETGEVLDLDPTPAEDTYQKALRAWGESLETNPVPKPGWKLPGRVVGIPCGPRGRYRRLGAVPLASAQPTVKAFEAWQKDETRPSPLMGVRALVSDGNWKVFRWERTSRKTGKHLHYAAVLPSKRYAWRPVQAALWQELPKEVWAPLRSRAHEAHAREAVDLRRKTDACRAIGTGLKETMETAALYRAQFAADLREARWQLDCHGGEQRRAKVEALRRALENLGTEPTLQRPMEPFRVNLI
jgi:hypothetical protein